MGSGWFGICPIFCRNASRALAIASESAGGGAIISGALAASFGAFFFFGSFGFSACDSGLGAGSIFGGATGGWELWGGRFCSSFSFLSSASRALVWASESA